MAADAVQQDPLVVQLERFQGPLDLLLHLIRKQDVDIFDIPISRITEQFLAAIKGAERLGLERAGEFLEMAATLIRIKAQLLFPRHDDEEEEDPRADLVRRLLEYEHFREAAGLLEGTARERARFREKGFVEARPAPRLDEAPLETQWDDVWDALLAMLERLEEPEARYQIRGRLVSIEEKIAYILDVLARASRVEFGTLVSPWGSRLHAVMSLLACLELTKRSDLRLRQSAPFAPLWVSRRIEEADAA
jgi:segregation and condensation protein A